MAADPRYDLSFEDPGSGERLDLMLLGPLTWASAEQMAQRVVEARTAQDFDAWSVAEQEDWHAGRAQEKWNGGDPARFYDNYNTCTWIRRQLTLGPLVYTANLGGTIVDVTGATSYKQAAPTLTYKKLAQSFTCAAHTCANISLYLRRGGGAGGNVTVRIETDSAGAPSGTLAGDGLTSTFAVTTLPDPGAWYTVSFPSGTRALAASTTYWIVLDASALSVGWVEWTARTDGAYANGSMSGYTTSWATVGSGWDGCFQLLSESPLAGTVSTFATYNGGVYCGAGKAVYKWDQSGSKWTSLKADFPNNVSDMVSFGGVLWVAQSDGNAWTYNGTAWTEKTGVTATRLLVDRGYLYRSTQDGTDNLVYYCADGATWGYPWKVGNYGRGERITGLTGYSYDVYVATNYALYRLGPESEQNDLVDRIKDWTSQADSDNGRGLTTWARDGRMYVPILHSLVQYQDGLLASVGPDEDAGLPSDRAGSIVAMVSLTNWLMAAVDAGTSGRSSVLLYNGTGWHELVRAPTSGAPCRALCYDTTVTPNRLWLGYGSQTAYVQFSDTTDNPYQATSTPYAIQGQLVTPWFGDDLALVDKDLLEVGLLGECPSGCTVKVYYECDHYGSWTLLGSVTATPVADRLTFPWGPAYATAPTVAAGSSIRSVNVDSTALMAAGDWVRIGDETRQVKSVDSSTAFTVLTPLSEAPTAGTRVYRSKPVAKSFRLMLDLTTTDITKSPKVEHLWVKYMPMLKDKRTGTCVVELTRRFTDRAGVEHACDIDATAQLLYSFAQRTTPFYCYDKAGNCYTVKVSNWQEVQTEYSYSPSEQPQDTKRRFTLALLEI